MLKSITRETRIVYLLILLSISLLVGSLPFVSIPVITSAPGIIRPAAEASVIRSPVSGKVLESHAVENAHVRQGDLLYHIDDEQLKEQLQALRSKLHEEKLAQEDVQLAIRSSRAAQRSAAPSFQTPVYRQSYRTFYEALTEATTAKSKASTEYTRQRKLFDARVIAASEYENYLFEREKADNRYKQVSETHRNQWELERRNIEVNIEEWTAKLSALELAQASYRMVAPVTGTLQLHTPIYPGTFVYVNQELAQITPDTSIIVVVFVKPEDMADLSPGLPVRLQVDAFHHHQWGMAPGHVRDIAGDTKNINNAWVYEVRCSLDNTFLRHSGGRIGHLRTGMTLRAHFPKYDQSLWELIYQQLDNRVNPYAYRP